MPNFDLTTGTQLEAKTKRGPQGPAQTKLPPLTSITQPLKQRATKPDAEAAQAQQVLMEQSKQAVQPPVETESVTGDVEKKEEQKPKFDAEELARIFDEIIFSGEYSEEVIIRGRLRVVFRTRNAMEVEQISRIVDTTQANLLATLSEKRSILNLQYALAWYQSENLASVSTEARAAFISKLPGPVVGALLKALGDFDEKVFEACKDAEENF